MPDKYLTNNDHDTASPKNTNNIALMIVIGVLLLGIGFVSGMQYQKGKNTNAVAANGTRQAGGFGGGFRRSGGIGTVTAVSSASITINEMQRGSDTTTSKTYAITSATTITDNGNTVSTSDISNGETVLIRTNSTDTTTATAITVNPSFGGGFGGSAQGGTTQSTPSNAPAAGSTISN